MTAELRVQGSCRCSRPQPSIARRPSWGSDNGRYAGDARREPERPRGPDRGSRLDRFKAINDRLGHRAGDQLLIQVAERLRAAVRLGDVAARIGGDEFVVAGEADDLHDAQRFGRRVLAAVAGCFRLEGEDVDVAASLGVSYVEPGDAPSADVVLAHADARMYEAKRQR